MASTSAFQAEHAGSIPALPAPNIFDLRKVRVKILRKVGRRMLLITGIWQKFFERHCLFGSTRTSVAAFSGFICHKLSAPPTRRRILSPQSAIIFSILDSPFISMAAIAACSAQNPIPQLTSIQTPRCTWPFSVTSAQATPPTSHCPNLCGFITVRAFLYEFFIGNTHDVVSLTASDINS